MKKVASLKGHDRPITHIKFNREGDLLFSSSKSKTKGLAVWDVETGELKGHYFGHDGAVSEGACPVEKHCKLPKKQAGRKSEVSGPCLKGCKSESVRQKSESGSLLHS